MDGGVDVADGVTCRAVLAGFEPHNLDGYPYFLVHEDGDFEAGWCKLISVDP